MSTRTGAVRASARLAISGTLTLLAAALLAVSYWSYSRSPQAVMRRAVHALEQGDASVLWRLADPRELDRCRLTHAAFASFLTDTLGPSGMPRHGSITRWGPGPPDMAQWVIDYPGPSPDRRYMAIPLVQVRQGGWKLGVSEMIRGLCGWRHGRARGLAAFAEWGAAQRRHRLPEY